MTEFLTLANLTAWALQGGCIAAAAWLFLRVLPVSSAGLRYGAWRFALLACFLTPWLAPAGSAPPPDSGSGPVIAGTWETVSASTATAMSPPVPLWWALAGVAAARAIWLLVGMYRLRRLRSRGTVVDTSEFADVQRAVGTRAEIRYVPDLAQPVTFGSRRPVVLLPSTLAEASDTVRLAVTTHELLHVCRRDWNWVLVEEAVRSVFWFNPAIWWLTSRVQLAREEVVDHLAVLATGSRRTYIEALLAFADVHGPSPAPAFARRRHLFTRIVHISKESPMSSVRVLLSALMTLGAVIAAGVFAGTTFPVDALAQQAAPAGSINPITPENPIPRRTYAVDAPHPAGLEDESAIVQVRVRLDPFGTPTVVERQASATTGGGLDSLNRFYQAAAESIAQWRYEPPAAAPMEFVVAVRFTPGKPILVTQNDQSRPVYAGPDGVRIGDELPGAWAGKLVDARRAELDKVPGESSLRRERAATESRSPEDTADLERRRFEMAKTAAALEAKAFGVVGGTLVPTAVAPPPPPPPPPPQPPATFISGPIRVGGRILPPVKTHDVRPVFPPEALAAKIQGVVILETTIDGDGRVSDVRVLRSIPALDQAAVDAVRQWKFTPTLLNGAPVSVLMTVTVQFTVG